MQEKDKEVASSLEETKRSLQTVEDQMQKLKSKHEKLVKKIERKNSHEQWLKKEKNARSGEDYCVMQDMIAEAEKAVAELSEKIIDLEKEIDAFRHKKKVINEKLLKQKDDKKQLEIELGKKQEELESVKKETEIQKKHLEEKIDQLRCELCEKKVKFHSINIIFPTAKCYIFTQGELNTVKGDLEHRRMLDVLQLKNHMHSTGKIPYSTLHRLVDVRDLPYNYG